MGKSTIWLSIIAILVSFVAGFVLANTINRGELSVLRAENDRLKKQPAEAKSGDAELTISNEQIRAAVAEADADPGNFEPQKKHGMGLYQYGALKKDPEIIVEASRLLLRANQLNPKDHDVVLGLAHSYFDTGFYKKENSGFEKAREYYAKALALKPQDVDTQTEIAMTYFLLDPPDYTRAIPEFEKSLTIDPKHVKTLQFLAQAYAKLNQVKQAEETVAKLRAVEPNNPMIAEVNTLIAGGGQTK